LIFYFYLQYSIYIYTLYLHICSIYAYSDNIISIHWTYFIHVHFVFLYWLYFLFYMAKHIFCLNHIYIVVVWYYIFIWFILYLYILYKYINCIIVFTKMHTIFFYIILHFCIIYIIIYYYIVLYYIIFFLFWYFCGHTFWATNGDVNAAKLNFQESFGGI
jgi:hypothetical protein